MKRYLFLLLMALTFIFAACSTDGDTSAYPDKLEIGLTPAWDATRGMTSASQTTRVTVTLNAQTVHWMVSSDSEWCVVDEEENHVGNGEFTVEVTANDDFKTRNAVVTLFAGSYSYHMEVDQSGNIFILDRIYSVMASGDTNTFDVKVKTLSKWQPVDSEWIHGEVISASEPDADGMTESTLRIRCDANTTAAGRYGVLTIEPTDGVGYGSTYTVYQFGTDVQFDEEGKLGLPARSGDAFEVMAPAEAIAGVTCPEWVTYTTVPAEDGTTATYTFAVTDNPSDTKTSREGTIEFSIRDIAQKTVLPSVKQNFYPAGGIVSGAGLKMLAEAFNAGESISDWTTEPSGKTIQIMGDVDMTNIEWAAMGTEARPFDGTIVGNEHKILNWSSSQPLFGYLAEGSEIRNLTIDSSSKVKAVTTADDVYTAAFAGVCNGTLKNCQNLATVTLDVTATASGATGVAGVAGLVGATGRVEGCSNKALITLGDNVSARKLSVGGVVAETAAGAVVTGCTNEGAIASNGATPVDAKAGLYTGGVVGYAGGEVANCTTEGGKTIALKIKAAYMSYTGGIVGWADSAVAGCTNKQPLSITASRLGDACRYAYAGGIVGRSHGEVSDCKNRGALTAAAICKFVIAGGITGCADGGVARVVNAANVTVTGNPGGASGPLAEAFFGPRYAYIGGVAGQVMAAGSITGVNGETTNSGTMTIEQLEYTTGDIAAIGGVAGMLLGSVSNTSNDGSVSISAAPTGAFSWRARCLGGIAGMVGEFDKDSKVASISGSSNTAQIKQLRTGNKAALPVYIGGVAGYILASEVSLTGCSNSGVVYSDSYNNNIDYYLDNGAKRANCTGGIVGAVAQPDSENPGGANTISGCTNSGWLPVYRGVLGGVAGYAESTNISGCTNTGNAPSLSDLGGFAMANRNGRSGGIVGHALKTQIENCVNRAIVVGDMTGDAKIVKSGGIVGDLQTGSIVRNCKHYGTVNLVPYGTASYQTLTAGGIAGTSVAGTEISNCGFGGEIKGTDAAHTFGMKLENVSGDKNFTAATANYLWDGK